MTGNLRRVMTFRHLALFGITFVTPTAPFPMFGIVSSVSHGHMALAYSIALGAMVLTAISYGRMAGAFPNAGSAYSYTRRTIHPLAGFLTGWTLLLDYVLLPLMSVIYLALTAARFLPTVPYGVWLVSFAALTTGLNLFGLKITNRANVIMTGLMTAVVAAFFALAAVALRAGAGEGVLLSSKPFYNPAEFDVSRVMAASAIAGFSFLGFDGISTLAEDARDPRRDIGRATIAVCLLCGALFIAQAYLGQLAWPDFRSFPQVDTAFLDLSQRIGGHPFLAVVSFILVVAGLASAISGQVSAARLLLGMERDRTLPTRIFTYIHPTYSTPSYGILAMGLVTMAGGFVFSFQLAAEAINFGALLGFMGVNLSVIAHYYIRGQNRGATGIAANLLMPGAGVLVCLYLFLNLSMSAKTIGAIWCALGGVYLVWRTRGFQQPLPELASEPVKEPSQLNR
ncbi:MAG: APC family permease [Bryobacterales bacterium]|nr:APC family permease [Bryobacterales bacterium]